MAKLLQQEGYFEEYYPIPDAEPVEPPPDRVYANTIQLVGPKSPLETVMYSTLCSGATKSVTVDPYSVNSVLLSSTQEVNWFLSS